MNDERDPRDARPDPDVVPEPDSTPAAEPQVADQPEVAAQPEMAGQPEVAAEAGPVDAGHGATAEPERGDDWPAADATSSASAEPAAVSQPADEFESQPSTLHGDDDATAEWPTSDQAAAPPPPSEIETYSATPVIDEPAASGMEPELVPGEVEAYASQPAAPDEASMASAAHTVPATSVGESTQCPRCGTENRPGLAFCRNCGQRLMAAGVTSTIERPGTPEGTQACPRCGTHNRAGTAFCQNCGANLRSTAPAGYVPPAVAGEPAVPEAPTAGERMHAVLGPIVLLIGAVGLATACLLPFPYGNGSLFERAFGSGGYGAAFWSGYPQVRAQLTDQGYFGFAAPVPLLILLLAVLAVAGFARARPGRLQVIGLAISLIWSIGLVLLFVAAEVMGGSAADLTGMLRNLTPGGIIFFLASLIVLIGTLTRFARG